MVESLSVKILYDPSNLEVYYVDIDCDDMYPDTCERCRNKPLCDEVEERLLSIKIGHLGRVKDGGEG